MRAVWYDRQGAADEVLVCGELPTPEAGHGEVRVRLEASGVNPSDTYRRRGPPTWAGARVIATVSSAQRAERARAGGAAHVINYRQEYVAARVLDITGGVGVDHI